MVSIRPATMDDILNMQNTNLWCLPENYNIKYYYYHILSWPQLLHVAEDHKGKIVGYVLAKMEDEEQALLKHGHVTSLSVLRTHRKMGLATQLMTSAHTRMKEAFDANFSALHVRESNQAAFHLYSHTLAYEIHEIERGYYADGEDAYDMRKHFKPKKGDPSPYELEQEKEAAAKKKKAKEAAAALGAVENGEMGGDAASSGGGGGGAPIGADDPPPPPPK